MNRLLALACVLFTGCAVLKDLKVAQSLKDKNVAGKPAIVQVTIPEDEDTTYAVDAGVGYSQTVSDSDRQQTDLTVGGEYHKNTVTDEPSDSTVVAVRFDQIWGDPATDSFLPGYGVNFKKDKIKKTESLVPTVDFTLTSKKFGIGRVIGRDGPVGFEWQPSLGAELEQIIEAGDDKPTGRVGRGWVSLDTNLYPLWFAIKGRLQLAASLRVWQDFAESERLDDGNDQHYLRTYSVNYFFDEEQRFGIGVDRVSGENPSEGEPEQHYTQIAFKIHLR